MKHVAVEQFWDCYNKLPVSIRRLTDDNFGIMKQYPDHPLLRLVRNGQVVSMRIGSRCRALGIEESETTIWFWVGSYKQYFVAFR